MEVEQFIQTQVAVQAITTSTQATAQAVALVDLAILQAMLIHEAYQILHLV